MIWYMILFIIMASPFAVYFIIKAFQAHFNKSKEYITEAILVKKAILKKEEIEKDIIFNETISSKNDIEYKFTFMLKNSNILEFNVLGEDFDKYQKDTKGILHYKKYLGIPTFEYFDII